jgi:hypothetical protein
MMLFIVIIQTKESSLIFIYFLFREMVHVCNIGGCTRSYMYRKGLLRHQKSHNMPARFNCQYCNLPFKRQQGFYLHQLRCGGNLRPRTPSPPPSPKRNNRPTKKREGFPVTRKSTAFQNANVTYRLEYERRNAAAELGENLEKSVKYMKKKIELLPSKEQNRHKIQHVTLPPLRTKRR